MMMTVMGIIMLQTPFSSLKETKEAKKPKKAVVSFSFA